MLAQHVINTQPIYGHNISSKLGRKILKAQLSHHVTRSHSPIFLRKNQLSQN